jgi:heme-degrading monooxygenase HmoA
MSRIVELRQYTLKPGQRDTLIALFEREFVESQEATGIELIGTFRDLDDPDRFVWLRGFPDMEARARSLDAFYGGPVWKAHREAANATMIDSDNVLLLRPAWNGSESFPKKNAIARPGIVAATICHLDGGATEAFVEAFRNALPHLDPTGSSVVGAFVTETSPNTFPALPVREGENVLVWLSRPENADGPPPATGLEHLLQRPPEVLRLSPTARSRLQA